MLNDILHTLLGAGLVTTGVLAASLADRIRGLRISRDVEPRESTPRTRREKAAPSLPVVETSDLLANQPRPRPRSEAKMQSAAQEVIAALSAAGYKKPVAEEAVWGCGAAERATIEEWTVAALRRCARGGLS